MTQNAVWDDEEMATIQNKDRLLPSQPYFSKMYNGTDFYGDLERVLQVEKPLDLNIKTKDGMTYAVMGSDLNTLRFIQFLIRSHGYKNALELGTYIGVSAMYMAVSGVHVITIEKGEEFFGMAKENFVANGFNDGLTDRIHPLLGDAKEILEKLDIPKFDLVFIDCAKESYKELLELSLPQLAPNGMILVDDVFFQGDTLNDNPVSEKGIGVRKMLDYVAGLTDYDKVILPIGNGLLMLRKK